MTMNATPAGALAREKPASPGEQGIALTSGRLIGEYVRTPVDGADEESSFCAAMMIQKIAVRSKQTHSKKWASGDPTEGS
jgi:hypothetical protein